jgi:hypothetical protein
MRVVGELTCLVPVDQFALHVSHHLLRLGFGLALAGAQHEAERRNPCITPSCSSPAVACALLLRLHQALVQRGDLQLVPFDDTGESIADHNNDRNMTTASVRNRAVW